MKDNQRAILQHLTTSFEFVGYSQRWYHQHSAPRVILHYLIGLGLIEVRTVTWDNWLTEPRIEDEMKGPFVEARLTPQGADVAKAQS